MQIQKAAQVFRFTVASVIFLAVLFGVMTFAFAQTTQTIQVPGPGTVTITYTPISSGGSGSSGSTGSGSGTSAGSGGTTTAFWVYNNGTFNWGGDYSYGCPSTGCAINYKDTNGKPASGTYDGSITTGPYGAYMPYAGGTVPLWNFDASPYAYLTFSLKPTDPNQSWQVYFIGVGDKPLAQNCTVTAAQLNQYGPTPQAGVWGTYKIALSRLCITGPVYKVAFQDQLGKANNLWYFNNLGFTK